MLRRMTLSVILLVSLISLSLLWLGYRSKTRMEQVLETQFNEQQLILARKISDDIEQQFDYLNQLLRDLARQKSSLLSEAQFRQHLHQTMGHLSSFDVLAVVEYGPEGQVQESVGYLGPINPRDLCGLSPRICGWFRQTDLRRGVYLSGILHDLDRFSQKRNFMLLVSPVYTPGTQKISGYLGLYLDPMAIAFRHTWDVQSGQTGYAWIIDSAGLTLAHYEPDFLGENYLTGRKTLYPQMDFSVLETLVTTQMLRRKEGMGQYMSGGHRGRRGGLEKLLAFTPVYLARGDMTPARPTDDGETEFWVVAVAAPRDEVYGLAREIGRQQLLMMGLFQICLLCGGGLIIYWSYRGLNFLEAELARQAAALAENHERLLHAERFAMLGKAMTHVTHEIKNPLALIGGFAQQLARAPESQGPQRDKLQIIVTEVKRLERFLGEIRDLTRPRAPARQLVVMGDLVTDTLNFMKPLLDEKQVHLEVQLGRELPALWLDPDQMRQVVVNLVKNAAEALEEHGTLTVTTRQEEDALVLEVTDDGCGIPPEMQEEVFTPFFTTKSQGSGLGLAISQKIIEDHGGTIRVYSGPGHGTTFAVRLPLAPAS